MDDISRRDFVKQSTLGTLMLAGAASEVIGMAAGPLDANLRKSIVAALGDLFVPSASGDPGYKDLEQYGITDFVLKNDFLEGSPALDKFNDMAQQYFAGKRFLDLDSKQREAYLKTILDEHKVSDENLRKELLSFYRAARSRIMTVYYQNYPEHEVKHKPNGEIIFKPGDTHQIANPNT